jgi:hypothetical protein
MKDFRAARAGTRVALLRVVENLQPNLEIDPAEKPSRPVQDEWGIYDPEQAGFEAILRRLGRANDAPLHAPSTAPDTPQR